MTTDTTRRTIPARAPRAGWLERLTAGGSWTVFALLVLVFAVILVMNPSFGEPMSLLAFVKKAAPQARFAIVQFKDRGELLLLKFADRLKDFGQLESMPKLEGKRMLAIFTPKTSKKPKEPKA